MRHRRVTPGFVGTVLAAAILIPLPSMAQATRSSSARASTTTWTPTLTPDGQPDLQGVWSDTSATPLERPRQYEGRPFLTDEEVARLQKRADQILSDGDSDFVAGDNLFLAVSGGGGDTLKNPNATGGASEMVKREFDNRTSLITDPPDGRIPPVTPAGLARQTAAQAGTLAIPWQAGLDSEAQRQLAASATRRLPGSAAELSNLIRCISWGVPKVALNTNYASHLQIVQSPDYIVLLSEVNHEARVVPLDGRPHLSDGLRQWHGDSRGRWEGRTLVIETANFSTKSFFRGSAERLHLVERFTRTGPETIEYEFTIDDSTTWTRPWTALVRLRLTQDSIYEFACHEGNGEVMRGILAGARAEERDGVQPTRSEK